MEVLLTASQLYSLFLQIKDLWNNRSRQLHVYGQYSQWIPELYINYEEQNTIFMLMNYTKIYFKNIVLSLMH